MIHILSNIFSETLDTENVVLSEGSEKYYRLERKIGNFNPSRWLDAVWEPDAGMYVLPGGMDTLDTSGDGDGRLIVTDLGTATAKNPKIRVYKGGEQVSEHNIVDPPCGVVGLYSETGDTRSAIVAVGAGSSVYIYKNMRAHFKYCLPHLDAHPKEREIWHKAGLEDEFNVSTLCDDLELLMNELGASYLSPRTLKLLAMDPNLRLSFAEEYRRIPLTKANVVTMVGVARKDSWNDPASSCLMVGTESGEMLVLDPRAFSVMDKFLLGWPPVAAVSAGLWAGDGQAFVIGREGDLGVLKKGCPYQPWDKLPAPAVAIASLGDGIAIAGMDSTLWGFSSKGEKLWRLWLPSAPLDLVTLPMPQTGLSLLAVSLASSEVHLYDGKLHVDTIKMMEPVSAMKFGKLGQEERAMAMVTMGGGLCVKILKRTADFTIHPAASSPSESTGRFAIPKKTRLFVEQSIRERAEAKKMYNIFQQGILRLKLNVAKSAVRVLATGEEVGPYPVTLEASILGLGPDYLIRLLVTNVSTGLSDTGLFLVCRDENADICPRVVDLPLLPSGIAIPITIKARPRDQLSGNVKILLCKKDRTKPIAFTNVLLPACEEETNV
ncbi:Bardet-Biedl syndrome 1 protein homolog [Orussus abietinus]|uniref:Bardet-Biedl syndrome 1 protein homolog n=1 Tax=Orussus abietinus TaxID=222816 RepID=UPI000C715E88|nr:Bardet-Biedl syndrome 1 protein homolog [Orussus abietinus]